MSYYRWLRFWRMLVRLSVVALGWWILAGWFAGQLYDAYLRPEWELMAAHALFFGTSAGALVIFFKWVIKAPSLWQPPRIWRARGKRRDTIQEQRDTWSLQLKYSRQLLQQVRRLRDEYGETAIHLELGDRETSKTLVACQAPSKLDALWGFIGFCLGNSRGSTVAIIHYQGTQVIDRRDLDLVLYPYGQPTAMTPVRADLPPKDGPLTTEIRDRVSLWLEGKAGADGSVAYLEAWRRRQQNPENS